MKEQHNKRKKKFYITDKQLLIALSVICIISILISYASSRYKSPLSKINEYLFFPMQNGINQIGKKVDKIEVKLNDIKELQKENKELKEKVAKLESDNSYLQQSAVELNRYRRLYKIDKELNSYHKMAARIISKDSSNWFDDFVIDKGSNQGIKRDMNVISDAGLVGIVTEVYDNYSKVMAIINDSSNVKAMTLNSQIQCFVTGDIRLMNDGYIRLIQAKDPNNTIKEGDKIVTSNISTKYLPGILIGYVGQMQNEPNQILRSGYLSPATNFSVLNEVLVITDLKESN